MQKINLKLLFFISALALFGMSIQAQTKPVSSKGAILKTPGKFMKAPLADFNGLLMLNPDAAAAVVVSYPNKGESIEDLYKRLLIKVPGFFNKLKSEDTVWTSKSVDVHEGDKANSGVLYSGKSSDSLLQFVSFQRESNGLTFVYGYFAMRSPKTKESDAKKYWLDENGKGVKAFDEFVKNLLQDNS